MSKAIDFFKKDMSSTVVSSYLTMNGAASEDLSANDVVSLNDDNDVKKGLTPARTVEGKIAQHGSEVVFNSANSRDTSVTTLDSTHVVVAYQDQGNSNSGTAIVGTISGTTISFDTEVVFNSGESNHISVTTLDATHVVVAYSDDGNSSYGTAIVGTISSGDTIAFGTAVVFNSAASPYISVTSIDSTHVVVAYKDDGNSNFGTAIVGTISSGDTIAFGTEVVFNSATSVYISVTALDSTHVVVAYQDYGNSYFGTAIVGTISSGDTIAFGTAVVFNSASSQYISVTSIDSTHVVVAYQDVGNSNYGTAIVGTISSGDTITFGTAVVFNSATSSYTSVTSIDSTHVVVTYMDGGTSNFGTTRVGIISSGDTIAFGTEVVFNSAYSGYNSVTALDSTHVVVAYKDDGASGYGTAIVGTISSGDTIAFGTEVVFNSANSNYISVTSIDSTHIVVAYKDDGNSYYGTAIVGETNDATSTDILGIVQTDTTSGNDVRLVSDGIVDGFSGLTPLTDYYVAGDGTLTTDSDDKKLGRALSPTQIFLDSTDFVMENI